MPQPMSTKQPNCSRCVTLAPIISPGVSFDTYSLSASSCAAFLDRIANGSLPVSSIFGILKQTGFPTLDISAISRVAPLSMPIAPSLRGIIPFIQPRSTCILCSASHTVHEASSIAPDTAACISVLADCNAAVFSLYASLLPSGKNSVI